MNVYSVLRDIASTPSKNEKLEIAKGVVDHAIEPLFKKVVEYAYSPYKMYNIEKFRDDGYDYFGNMTLEETFDVLDALQKRTVTGLAATALVEQTMQNLSEEDASVFARIVRKDLRCGASESTFNKVWEALVYTHPYMRCSSFSQKTLKKIKYPCVSEVKEDGLYVDILVNADQATVRYVSRAGHELPFGSELRDGLLVHLAEKHGSFVIMGETLVVSDETGEIMPRSEGNGYLNNEVIDTSRLRFKLWDFVPLVDFEKKKSTMRKEERNEHLQDVCDFFKMFGYSDISRVLYHICNNPQELIEHAKTVMKGGGEGTVVKNIDALWKDGTSTDQIKIKIVAEGELLVTGVLEGTGRLKGKCGSLVCVSSCGEVVVNVAGLSDALRLKFFKNPELIIGKIITVRYNDVVYSATKKCMSLFLPRYVETRLDKTEADDLKKLQEQLKSAIDILAMWL